MVCYVAILDLKILKGNPEDRPHLLGYLDQLNEEDNRYIGKPFEDHSGELVIYQAENYEEALNKAEKDLYTNEKSKHLEINKWSTYVYSSLFNQPLL